jgi:cytidylate kinase
MIIAVDGPAASGKGTLARRLAAHYNLHYLDTGSLYRAVGLAVQATGGDPADDEAALEAARDLELSRFSEQELRADGAGEAASIVAANPEVRQIMLDFQRRIAAMPPGAVLDGRDIGTVVCPDADVKLFVTADVEVRARRRHSEQLANGEQVPYEAVLADLMRRDERDANRAVAPLRPAPDAHLLDTTKLDIEAAFQAAVDLIDGII